VRFSDIECHRSGDDGERMGVGVRSPIIYLPRHFHCVGGVIFGIFIRKLGLKPRPSRTALIVKF
jgi:hypothetical protein